MSGQKGASWLLYKRKNYANYKELALQKMIWIYKEQCERVQNS